MNKRSVQEELLACQSLVDSVAALLALPDFSEAERQLLRKAAQTAQRRQRAASARLTATVIGETVDPAAQQQLRDNMLEAQVATLMQGHDLQPWEETDDGGYQSRCNYCGQSAYVSHQCNYCGQSVYVSHKTLYSLLPETCLGRRATQGVEDGSS
jgi:hypothetical protein